MIREDLSRAFEVLNIKLSEPKLDIVLSDTKNLYIDQDQLIEHLGRNINTKTPAVKTLVTAIFNISKKDKPASEMYELIRLDADDDEHYVGLQGTIEYSFVMPMILFCTDVASIYKTYIEELFTMQEEKPNIYEIAWMWLFNKEYKHDLPIPESVMFPKLWKFYGMEA